MFLLIGCVVAEIYGHGSSSASAPTLAILDSAVAEQVVARRDADRALSEAQNRVALCWTRPTKVIGQVVNTRVLGKGTAAGKRGFEVCSCCLS